MPCPDCKDGFYYPLNGPKEPCQTCNNIQNLTKALANAAAVRMKQQAEGRIHRVSIDAPIVESLTEFQKRKKEETVEEITIQPSLSRIPVKPMEYAKQIKQALQHNPSMTLLTLAQQVSKSVPYLQRYLDLLKLLPATQLMVNSGRITMDEALSKLTTGTSYRTELKQTKQEECSVHKRDKAHYYGGQVASMVKTQEEKDAIWASIKTQIQGTSAMISKSFDCTDCSDGFYYPLSGPREVCQTCGGPTATKNLHNALADQVLRQAEGRYARTPVSEVNVEVTPPNDAELIRLLARKKQYMAAYINGKNEIFSELYGGPPARDITPLELVEKGLTVKEAQEVARKLHRYTTQVNLEAEGRMNRGGLVPQGIAFDVETSGQVNIGKMSSSEPSSMPKGHFLEPIYGDKVDAAVAAQNTFNRLVKERMTTDWAKYLPDYLKHRADLAKGMFLKDEASHQGDIVKTIVTQFFKMPASRIEKASLVRSSVTVAQLAVAVTEFTTKLEEIREITGRVSKKALKENGFIPTL